MKYIIIIQALWLAHISAGQVIITTFDTRTNGTPVRSQYRAIDVGVLDAARNPDAAAWMRSFPAPALVDIPARIGVSITGTVAQAEADLAQLLKAAYPAQDKLRGVDRAELIKDIKAGADRAQGVRALAIQMERLADLVAAMIEQQQSQER